MKEILNSKSFYLFNSPSTVCKFIPGHTKVFSSNTVPVKISFETEGGKIVELLYKYSDDLRQDQLILQLVGLMDHLLKKVKVELRLTVYSVLAFSPSDGMMEFVQNSTTIQNALNEGTIDKYLKKCF